MDRVYESLDRMKALWRQLEKAKYDTPEYDSLIKQIRAEVDVYKALVEQRSRPGEREESR